MFVEAFFLNERDLLDPSSEISSNICVVVDAGPYENPPNDSSFDYKVRKRLLTNTLSVEIENRKVLNIIECSSSQMSLSRYE